MTGQSIVIVFMEKKIILKFYKIKWFIKWHFCHYLEVRGITLTLTTKHSQDYQKSKKFQKWPFMVFAPIVSNTNLDVEIILITLIWVQWQTNASILRLEAQVEKMPQIVHFEILVCD